MDPPDTINILNENIKDFGEIFDSNSKIPLEYFEISEPGHSWS